MNFQVPQFIEEKAKIVGFLTLAQFLYVAGGFLLIFIAFKVFTFFLWILISSILTTITAALAFGKVNGRSMPQVLASAFTFFITPRLYTWQREIPETDLDFSRIETIENMRHQMSIQEKLKSIALHIATGKLFTTPPKKTEGESYRMVTYLTGEKKLAKKIDY